MAEITLKPCPFCGYAIFADHNEQTSADAEAICCVFDGEDESHYYECPRCEAQGPKADTTEDAAEGWNTRQAEAKVEGFLDEVEKRAQALWDEDSRSGAQSYHGPDFYEISGKVRDNLRAKALKEMRLSAHLSQNPHANEGAE